MALVTAPASGVAADFRGFFAAGACPNLAATDFRCPGFAAAALGGGSTVPPRADFSVAKVRRVFFVMIVV
jgi:hypothetical protein